MVKVENFSTFSKLHQNQYTKNDKMNMFGEFQLKITPGSAKTVTPILVKIPQKMGVSQKWRIFHFPEIFHEEMFI